MVPLAHVLDRIHARGAPPSLDADFDDAFSSDSSCAASPVAPPPPGEAPVHRAVEVQETLADAASRLRGGGASDALPSFLDFVATRANKHPAWRRLPAPTPCAAFPDRPAQFELVVRSDDDDERRLNVSEPAFLYLVGALYYATFRLPHADAYARGVPTAEVDRNYALARQCVLAGL
jgi:hypothetical protein